MYRQALITTHTPSKRRLPLFIVVACAMFTALPASAEMQVQRLTWSGVKFVNGDTTVLVDPVDTDLWNGNAPEGLVPISVETRRRYALITHAHNDHFDPQTLQRVLGDRGYVICAESIATHIASRGFKVIPAKMYTPVSRGGFVFTAVPAEDGLGDDQVSWIISSQGQRYFHGGDTLWHGKLPLIGEQYGPIDAAFLPINGAILNGSPKSEIPAVLTPAQAVDAAIQLRAKTLVPIHFGLNDPPHYVEFEDAIGTVKTIAKRRGVKLIHLKPGETLANN